MGIYEELGIDFNELGCVMLDVETPQFKKTPVMTERKTRRHKIG